MDTEPHKIARKEQYSTLLWVFVIGLKMFQDVGEMDHHQRTHQLQHVSLKLWIYT